MNRSYALVWNPTLGAWRVADEHARRRAKGAGAVLAAALLLPVSALAADLPSGGQVVSGAGNISQPNAQQMVIDQASNKLAIDWQSFDIAAGHKVTFNQPGADAIALNRVLGADGTKIMGQLDANGRVFIVNPNGVLFGQGASVNVGGLVASTLDISNSDFEAGNYRFKGDGSNASVVNNGQITAADGGSVALLGGTVSNNGVILANQGSVALAAGNAVTLDFAGDGLLNVQVDEAVVDALVENHQLIKADGGQVLLTANAGDALLKTVVNNTGVIEAQTLGEKNGKIVLLGDFDGGTVQVAGTLDASAPTGGNGGFIETSGAHVKVADSAKVTTKAANGKTGTWLIDPNDFTVAATGGDMSGAAVSAAVQNNNFEIQTATMGTAGVNGDIHINDAITWSSANTLTLTAERDININAAITASDANGKLALNYGQASADGGTADYHIQAPINLKSGNNFSTQKGSTGSVITYTVVNDADALQDMKNNLADDYALGSDIDLSIINNWEPVGGNGAPSSQFAGKLAGLGHTLSKLKIDLSSTNYVGLFGYTDVGSVIRDIGLLGGEVQGRWYVGGLVGINRGTLSNVYATGSVTSTLDSVGGLVGENLGTVSNAYATGNVSGSGSLVGGLAGQNYGTISNVYATGTVTGSYGVGGLVGYSNGTISNAYATGTVTGSNSSVGGLAGENYGTISNAYATGTVTGNSEVGGLVGYNEGNINNAYATGTVTGNSDVGGLVGYQYYGTISNAYATGKVSGGAYVGGLVGINFGTLSNAHWDSESTGQAQAVGEDDGTTSGVSAVTSSNRYTHEDYSALGSWNLVAGTDNVYAASDANGVQWIMIEGQSRPFLASEYSTTIHNAHQLQLMAYDLGAHYTLAADIDASATAGINASDMWSSAGFMPIGSSSLEGDFSGQLEGSGHSVSGLTIHRSGTDYVGLFGYTGTGSVIRDIGLLGGEVKGGEFVGGLVGYSYGTLSNVYATGKVSGSGNVGGLVGGVYDSTISDAYATGDVSGTDSQASDLGGLVGYSVGGTFMNVYATGNVSGNGFVGGLVGGANRNAFVSDYGGTISNAYATGTVTGSGDVGGLVGYNSSTLSNVYATGDVSGSNDVGGLVGYNSGTLSNAYATGNVSGSDYVGGLVGGNYGDAPSDSFYATTDPAGDGINNGGLTSDTFSGNQYGTGKTAAELTHASTFAGWGGDIAASGGSNAIWRIYEGNSTPLLRSFLKPLTLTVDDVTGKTYDGTTSTVSGVSYSLSDSSASVQGSASYASVSTRNAGTYDLGMTGFYSNQQGYDITVAAGSYTISKASLTVTAADASKTYDGIAYSGGNGVSYSGFVNSEDSSVLGGTLTYGGNAQSAKNAGTYTLSASGLTSGNYNITYTNGSLNVAKANLSITANNASKTYDGIAYSGGNGVSYNGFVNSEDSRVLGGTLSYGGNAQSAKNAGTYTLSASGLTADNYAITYADGSLTVAQKALTITGTTVSGRTYDGTTGADVTAGSLTGFINNETVAVSASGTFDSKNAGARTVTANYTLTDGLNGGLASNYSLASTSHDATISKAELSVSGLSASNKTYNGNTTATLTGTASMTGKVYDQDGVTLSGTGSGAFADKNVGTGKAVTVSGYTLSGADAGNYTLVMPTNLTANISKAALTVTTNNASKTYDGIAYSGGNGVSYRGFVNSEDSSVLGGTLTYGGNAQSAKNAGTYTLSASGLTSGNYNITYADGSLNVAKANLIIIASNASKTAGQDITLNGYSTIGLKGDDSISSLRLSSLGQPSTAAAGSYAIVASDALGSDLNNYAISYQDGTLQVADNTSNNQYYIGSMIANSQTGSAPETTQPANEPVVQNTPMLLTNPLADITNLQVIDQGLRLPEGI